MEYQKLASLDQDDIDLALHCIALIQILRQWEGETPICSANSVT
ncbi:hypothetical protein FOFC_21082 [Fusarium oxysporum]|nr:hypothetical protein FOFC_21082 [Fusarium oxysporum]